MSQAIEDLQLLVESALLAHLPQCRHPGARQLDDALHYSVFPGGKRLRPILSILGARIFTPDPRPAFGAACAVEFIHTASLIFDDLPAMDDARMRRGLPCIHKVYGEEVAMLTAIALLNQSYALFGRVPALIAEATECIGTNGMIGGQALDLTRDNSDEEALLQHSQNLVERNRKTSAMMRLALTAGALACGVPPEEVEPLGRAGQWLGEAYQIGDDLLDLRTTTGKTAGQDQRHKRPSSGLLDEKACLHQLQDLVHDARTTLRTAYGERAAAVLQGVDRIFNAHILEASHAS